MRTNEKELLGMIPKERIKALEVNRPSNNVIAEFLKYEDMSGMAARALDGLGIVGAISSATLRPLIEGKKVVGPAITVRDVPSRVSRYYGIVSNAPNYQIGECEAYFVGEPGDVIVRDVFGGQTIYSGMGGESASIAKSRGIAGSIIDGVCTGVPRIRKVGYPVWCRGGTPVTGGHRIETVEINGTVSCAGVQVQPGDLIVADDTGVAVVPNNLISKVLGQMKKEAFVGERVQKVLDRGGSPSEIRDEKNKYHAIRK